MMNTAQALINRYNNAKKSKREYLTKKLEQLEKEIKQKKPFAFSYEPFSLTKEKYSQLLNQREYISHELEKYYATARENLVQTIAIIVTEIVLSLWFIVFILYRTLTGSEYFLETIPEFIINIFGKENAIIVMIITEAFLIVAFSFLFSQIAKNDLSYKRFFFFRKLFYICSTLFILTVVLYLYLSSI